MAISFISHAAAGTTSVAITTPTAGDVILVFAYRNATTAPSLPAGYTNLNNASGNSNSYRIGYKISDGTETGSSTWTNANVVHATVYRGVGGFGAIAGATKAASTTSTLSALTMIRTNSSSWVVAFAGSRQTTAQGTPLAGATTSRGTQAGTTSNAIVADTNGVVNSFSATTSSNSTSVVSSGITIELLSLDSFSTFTEPFNTGSQNTNLWQGNFGTLSWAPAWTITNPISYTGYGGMTSIASYDLTGASINTNIASAGNQSLASLEFIPVQVNDLSGNNKLFLYINGNTLVAYKTVSGAQTSLATIAYNSGTMTWFRIKEASGTTFWEYGSDGTSWTTLFSVANPINVTQLFLAPSMGTFSAEASSTTAVWNSFNASSSVSASVTQLAATVTATGGTQVLTAVRNVSISQAAATVTAAGGTQTAKTNTTITQVAANVTATGGSQTLATVNNSSITQLAATVTATGGTQTLAAVRNVSLSQVAGIVTATGGTQTVAATAIAYSSVSLSQIAAIITVSGGIQRVVIPPIYTPFLRTLETTITTKTDNTPTNLANVETTVTIKTIDNPTNASDVESKTNSVSVETTSTEKTIG